ncbi:MAG TPA: methyltransferase domain-containing protein [Ignavibacteriales bacterium]|nr:methyltransferase domain-containing protein [Ignavibacteriales bacterium]
MAVKQKIFLPGSGEQLRFLENEITIEAMTAAVFGSGSAAVAKLLQDDAGKNVELIVEDYESYMQSQLELKNLETVKTRIMSFAATDFKDDSFDLIYAQGSISGSSRVKILKEIKRILKPGGILCAGEIVKLSKDTPRFILDVWKNSDLSPLHTDEVEDYYKARNFSVLKTMDLSRTLRDFYLRGSDLLKINLQQLSEQEKSYNKKLINRMSHETNVYLKQGGDKHIGFKVLIVKNEK